MNDEILFAREDEMEALNTVDDTVDSQNTSSSWPASEVGRDR